jgi:hypothetical protein
MKGRRVAIPSVSSAKGEYTKGKKYEVTEESERSFRSIDNFGNDRFNLKDELGCMFLFVKDKNGDYIQGSWKLLTERK